MTRNVLRKDIDDIGRRNTNKDSYRSRILDGKKTVLDDYTGERIYINNRYTANKKINIDHIVPIDTAIERYSEYISVDELKKIVGNDYNLAATNESLNKSKGAKSNLKYIIDNLESQKIDTKTMSNMLINQISAEINMNIDVGKQIIFKKVNELSKIDNSSNQSNVKGIKEHTEIMAYSIALNASKILYRSYSGEISVSEATEAIFKDTGITIAQSTVNEMVLQVGQTLKSETIINVGNLMNSQATLTIINSSINLIRYVNSDIDGYQCVNNLIFEIIKSPAFIFSYAVGGPIGGLLTTSILSEIQSKVGLWLYEWQQSKKITKMQIRRYNELIDDFNRKIDSDREVILGFIKNKNEMFDSLVMEGYYTLCKSIMENNYDEMTKGLNLIMEYFNKEVLFQDSKKFDEYFFDDSKILTI